MGMDVKKIDRSAVDKFDKQNKGYKIRLLLTISV